MDYEESEYLSLSGIQHFDFCQRQWALIHIEQQWFENVRTLEGQYLHRNAHDHIKSEKRGDVIISRSMPVFSRTMGISGICDIVEFHLSNEHGVSIFGRKGRFLPVPIEYKRGETKTKDCDRLQLCAQAMCLEEMLLCHITFGYLYYGESKRKVDVLFDHDLREKVVTMLQTMHELYKRRFTPKAKRTKACNACSLKDVCLPKLAKSKSVKDYIDDHVKDDLDEEVT